MYKVGIRSDPAEAADLSDERYPGHADPEGPLATSPDAPRETGQATPRDRATAYHEAGHAVVALWHERPVHKVNILPQGSRLGVCEFRKGVHRPSNDWLETEMLIALAGLAAEALATGRYDWAGATKDLQVTRKLAQMRADGRAAERLEKRMLSKVQNLLGDPGLWLAVETIAQALLERGELSGRAAVHFFEVAMKNAEKS